MIIVAVTALLGVTMYNLQFSSQLLKDNDLFNYFSTAAAAAAAAASSSSSSSSIQQEDKKPPPPPAASGGGGSKPKQQENAPVVQANSGVETTERKAQQQAAGEAAAAAAATNSKTKTRRTHTDAGVDVSHPNLYETIALNPTDSSTATVMGMASGYTLGVYQRFVGSLRKSGFTGHIILGVAPDVSDDVLQYFRYRNVTAKIMQWVNCTYLDDSNEKSIFKATTCAHPYPDIKIRWSRFPLLRDWLQDCITCTGPVLVMDVRDSIFQRDPFAGEGAPTQLTGLQVYEEHKTQTTQHWLAKWPIHGCKNVEYHETMLCSGTTTGTRPAMLAYLEAMYAEMKVWIQDPKCRFDINGDDQSIHNYLFYSGQLPFATAIPNRHGGIVNTVGVEGSNIFNAHKAQMKSLGKDPSSPYQGAKGKNWLSSHFNVTDDEGFFTEFDGSRSRVIHQWDRFGVPYQYLWLDHHPYFHDQVPPDFEEESTTQQQAREETTTASKEKEESNKAAVKEPILVPSAVRKTPTERRLKTDAGVDVSNPKLYETINLAGDSSTATVMGMASGYHLRTYQSFVGSLRKSGYKGHIILGVAPDVPSDVLRYLAYRNVTVKVMRWVNCTYLDVSKKDDIFKETTCAHPYPDIKIRWSRFPLQRDWLLECKTCTGPALAMDVRDSIFQLDPFGPGSPPITGLQVYEEHKDQTTGHWLTDWPIGACKGVRYNETMLCSGTTTGTREAMLTYLNVMYEEMKVWINDPKCRFDINGDDQSMHNYLYYSGQLPFATAIANRHGGIVNTVGFEGANLWKAKVADLMGRYNLTQGVAADRPYFGASDKSWIGQKFKVTDTEGFFTEFDGSRSRVIHQYDRFGSPLGRWLKKQAFYVDEVPADYTVFKEPSEPLGSRKLTALPAKARIPIVRNSVPRTVTERRLKTDTEVDLSSPKLYDSIDLRGDSSSATVMGMATGYRLDVFQRFVGSLRKSGYQGHIILGVAPDVPEKVLQYLSYRNVTAKVMRWVNCTYAEEGKKDDIFKATTCAHPYPNIKIRWSRFPLLRDWLEECITCTGPVLVVDVRDTLFQLDPFGSGSPPISGLQVYEEHQSQTTQHWLTQWPIGTCKGFQYNETMLCSGSTTGTREAMLKYLEVMYEEMKVWIEDPKCRFDINGDDQSIHNYLYYSGQLPFATAIPNRSGGIVNTVGVVGSKIRKAHKEGILKDRKKTLADVLSTPFAGAAGDRWIGADADVTDDRGFFTEQDGSLSRVVHQFDRFGYAYTGVWLKTQDFVRDGLPRATASKRLQ